MKWKWWKHSIWNKSYQIKSFWLFRCSALAAGNITASGGNERINVAFKMCAPFTRCGRPVNFSTNNSSSFK